MITTQTKNDVTFSILQAKKSFDYAWSENDRYTEGAIPTVRHSAKCLIVTTSITSAGDYIDSGKIQPHLTITDPQFEPFEPPTALQGATACSLNLPYQGWRRNSTIIDGIYYSTNLYEYLDSTETIDIDCQIFSTRESDCEVALFENIPLDAKGITKSGSDCEITLKEIREDFKDTERNHWIELELSVPRERKHLGVQEYIDNLGNQDPSRGSGWRDDRGQMFQIYKLHPDALSISFKYLILRKELSFQLQDIPLP